MNSYSYKLWIHMIFSYMNSYVSWIYELGCTKVQVPDGFLQISLQDLLFLNLESQPSPSSVPFVESQKRESNYKSLEIEAMPFDTSHTTWTSGSRPPRAHAKLSESPCTVYQNVNKKCKCPSAFRGLLTSRLKKRTVLKCSLSLSSSFDPQLNILDLA